MKTEHAYTDAAQRREEEVREHISWFREFLTFGTELPETIRRQYGLEEDYRRYMELAERDNRMFEEADGTECILVPMVIVMYGYSHAPQITDIAGHIISRREVNKLHPCVLFVCQYKIVFHALSVLWVFAS